MPTRLSLGRKDYPMGFEHFNEETISYAKRLIQYKSQQLVGRAGLSESDIDDLKQEMWADLLRRFSWFESDRAKAETFIDRVLSHRVAAILRRQCGASRNYRRNGESLSSETEDADGQIVELAQTLPEDVHDLRTGAVTRPALEQFELASDIQTVLAKMPAPLRELCQLLKTEQISVAASEHLISRFKGEQIAVNLFGDTYPRLKYLVNVNVLTTGFDAPNVDCVVLLRPTASPGLYYQMVGRGFRLHPDKTDALVLDYGGNILRHGPVDAIAIKDRAVGNGGEAPAKECPECRSVIHAAYSICPDCDYKFPPPENDKHDASASAEGILTGEVIDTEYDVEDVCYCVHKKRGAGEDAPQRASGNLRGMHK